MSASENTTNKETLNVRENAKVPGTQAILLSFSELNIFFREKFEKVEFFCAIKKSHEPVCKQQTGQTVIFIKVQGPRISCRMESSTV